MLKKCKVVMLPTKEKSTIYRNWHSHASTLHLGDFAYCDKGDNKRMNQHLYITSDEEIKEGDWVLYHEDKISQVLGINIDELKLDRGGVWRTSCKKIIATTDSSLKYTDHRISPVPNFCDYPQPSQSFIEKYIEEYNKGNVITDVLVEYEEYGLCIPCNKQGVRHCAHPEECGYAQTLNRIKINPKDNTITIKQVKDSWNRQEVENLIFQFANDAGQDESLLHHYGSIFNDAKKWIKENL